MSKRVTDAREGLRLAELELEAAMKADYPPGTPITWRANNRHWQHGVVVMNCYGDRIKVRNDKSGRECFIHSWRLHEMLER